MIRPHVPLTTRYVDYGKVFVPNGALDFSALAASDPDVARYGPLFFNRGLSFPESSHFAAQIGNLSAALLMFEGGYLFAILQRRREGELAAPGAARTDRPFNQVRFVVLNREQIEQAFANRTALYSGLVLAARDPEAKVWLRDYTTGAEQLEWNPRLERLDPAAPNPDLVRFVANAVVASAAPPSPAQPGSPARPALPQPISVPLPGADFMQKLQLVEAVQYWLLPRLGIISFALDYITIQNVHLRLFNLPDDAPAPLPPERVFELGRDEGRLSASDEFSPLAELAHEALYDDALPGLLSLPLATADAVRLFQVEKLGQAFDAGDAVRLYPQLGRLGERRLGLLRRVPRADLLALLAQEDLPDDLRLDLLQVVFDAAHGLLALYAPAHLAVPPAARDDERVRALLRASLAKSPEGALDQAAQETQHQLELQIALLRDLLLARRMPAPAGRGQPAQPAPLTLATGQPLLEALLVSHRTPALAAALREVAVEDASLFRDALAAFEHVVDLNGLLWLWQNAGQDDFGNFAALLERAVQPGWYGELASRSGAWRRLLADGRDLVLRGLTAVPDTALDSATPAAEPDDAPGCLLRALPRGVVPFVWQASLAVAATDAVFAEWWLFNEALALPEQLPALWDALERLPPAALREASPRLSFLLGRAEGMSLLEACTPPDHDAVDESLFATVLRAWLARGFRSPVGSLALASDDLRFLIDNLPGSNDILAAVAASPPQAPAVAGLPPGHALRWARVAAGERRGLYLSAGHDILFQRLIELPAADEALLWHLLVDDDGSSSAAMSWPAYAALVARVRARAEALPLPAGSRLRVYLEAASRMDGPGVADAFSQNKIDLRRVLALLARYRDAAAEPAVLVESLLPLAAFHLQADSPDLKDRTASLLRAGLLAPEVTSHLLNLPDQVLGYLREHFCLEAGAVTPVGHWIDAELSRRSNSLRLQTPARPAGGRAGGASRAQPRPGVPGTAPRMPQGSLAPAAANGMANGALPSAVPTGAAPPTADHDGAGQGLLNLAALEAAAEAAVAAAARDGVLDGAEPPPPQPALPSAAPRRKGPDTAVLLWVLIIFIALLIIGILVGAFLWIDSLNAQSGALPRLLASLVAR